MTRLGERGAAAVEFAVVTPVLALMIVGVVAIGFATNQQIETQDAAAAGALYATEHGWDPAGITNTVTGAKPGSNPQIQASPAPALKCGCPTSTGIGAWVTCGFTCPDNAAARRYVVVSASVARVSFVAFSFGLPANFNATATARIP